MRHVGLVLLVLAVIAPGWAWRHHSPETMPVFLKRWTGVPPNVGNAAPVAAEAAPGTPPAAAAEPNPPLYKWRDANGTWNITDTPPKGRAFEKVVVDPAVNVVPTEIPGRGDENVEHAEVD